jgi:hypothetical protein
MASPIKPEEKVIYLYDEGGAVGTLKDVIAAVREDRVKHFAIVAQIEARGDEDITFGPGETGDEPNLVKHYFYGDCLMTVQGLLKRLGHLIDLYIDGVDIFGEEG